MAYIVKVGSWYVGIARSAGSLSGRKVVIKGGYELVDSLDKAEPLEGEEAVRCMEEYSRMKLPDYNSPEKYTVPDVEALEYH